jgi:hypothetical protein
MLYPTQVEEREKVPYRQTGWVGENWLDPETHKYKTPIRRQFQVCGLCAAGHWADEYEGDDSMNGDELREQLSALATMESGARLDLLDAMRKGEIPIETPTAAPKRRKAGKRKSRRNTRPKLPPMTVTQATTFTSYSVANATIVDMALSCGCVPYETVFTFRRWKAQGMSVMKGEKAIRIPVVKDVESTDADTGEITKSKRVFGTAAVFCKCQVKPIGEKSQTPSQSEVAA